MPGEPPDVALTEGRVGGALAVGGGSGLLCTAVVDLRGAAVPVTSCCGTLLREENSLSLAKRLESELQLTRLTAVAAVSARRDQDGERTGSATLRMRNPLVSTQDERVKHPRVNNFLSLKRTLNPNESAPFCCQFDALHGIGAAQTRR